MDRRDFIGRALAGSMGLLASHDLLAGQYFKGMDPKKLNISLAQWSLHRALEKGEIKAEDFAGITRDRYQIEAVEYVNAFYEEHCNDEKFWTQMNARARDAGVKNLLIMVDNEGQLGDPQESERKKAVENHYKWVDAARIMNCHSIRVNAFGTGDRQSLKYALTDGLGHLASYGRQQEIHILIENHGLHTSDAHFITEIIKEVDNPYLGTLPDFGNWCLSAEWGSTQGGRCEEVFDPYLGLELMLPFARGVSAKSYDFDTEGSETSLDYSRFLKMVKSSEFDGYIGIEYEGSKLSEDEGIKATKKLIEKVWASL